MKVRKGRFLLTFSHGLQHVRETQDPGAVALSTMKIPVSSGRRTAYVLVVPL